MIDISSLETPMVYSMAVSTGRELKCHQRFGGAVELAIGRQSGDAGIVGTTKARICQTIHHGNLARCILNATIVQLDFAAGDYTATDWRIRIKASRGAAGAMGYLIDEKTADQLRQLKILKDYRVAEHIV